MTPTVLISGGSRGLGAELVGGFRAQGCNVACFSRTASPFIEGLAGADNFHWAAIDGRDHDAVQGFINETVGRFGRVDVLINNSGIAITSNHLARTSKN